MVRDTESGLLVDECEVPVPDRRLAFSWQHSPLLTHSIITVKRAFPPIYNFDLEQNKIHLLAIGHRSEIYRDS